MIKYGWRCRNANKSLRFSSQISTRAVAITDPNEEHYVSSLIIQDSNLLRKSHISVSTTTGLHVLDLIDRGSLQPNPKLYNTLLKKCTHFSKLKQGRIVHAHVLNSTFKHDLVILNTILAMYVKCGCLDDGRKMFDEMPVRDVVSWTTLITGYSQHDRSEDALVLFVRMLREGFKPNEFTLSSVLKAALVEPSYLYGGQMHAFCLKSAYIFNVYVGSCLLDLYARCGNMDDAHLIFDGIENKNEVSWNALIAGHARNGQAENALRLLWKMLREFFEPTPYTYSAVFNACATIGSLEQGKWVHAHLIKSGTKLVAFVGNTLLHMYAKSGNIEDAKKVFYRLIKQDVVAWNSMLTAYAQHGLGKEAVQLFQKMLKTRVAPNGISFLSVLTACSHSKLLDEGHHYFDLMKKYKVEPQVSHYVSMVDLLGRAGLLDRAEQFIKEMPIEPTAAVWGALLGACRMHKNMDLGTYAAEHLFELDPTDSGPYVLLYNIFASAGRWSDAAKVRKRMKERGIKKEPACSWVEIENAVHMFMADDDAHPQREEIHKMWENVSRKIKEIGYVPDTSNVPLYVDQQERKMRLQYHSEKLALAFALLKSPPGSTIQIKKNIRVCGDCHSAIKYVSKVMEREIVVRDTNRFHHFRDGSCSCGDYW
ncbi:PPR domain-containing protein/PPR_2 domain-containing protein/DYW_deaminase domain-containing protein [Cephalotus follicularis]|uniref:PPR domain-containing protein/PPR_2 domain-containing protein/DYW_deaminase domain-containing protein n=1 Tax=Cephalotus follicularis TaxID=3775 RepID=A0A1Q3BRT6_CEPFO|nr:PPR domain-containing protein/PPR_2 domain-containing protein/DYW_deaminase domain-containing protein [Cephalotus follicularis]